MSAFSSGPREQRSQAPYNIFLIEDDEATSEMLTLCIESEFSQQVRTLSSGEETLQYLQENRESQPSIFIIDYLLPGMNGLQLLDHLQSFRTLEQVPAILITAVTITDDMKATLHNHNVALLTKPLDLADLIDSLEYIHNNSFQQLL